MKNNTNVKHLIAASLLVLGMYLPAHAGNQTCCSKDTTAPYLEYEVYGHDWYLLPPVKGLQITKDYSAFTLQSKEQSIRLQLMDLPDNGDYAAADESASASSAHGDTLLNLHSENGKVSKDILKIKYKVPATWENVQNNPDLIGDESAVWLMEYKGPSGRVVASGNYPFKLDPSLSAGFQKSLCSFYVDSFDYEEPPKPAGFEVSLNGTGLKKDESNTLFTGGFNYSFTVSYDDFVKEYHYYPERYWEIMNDTKLYKEMVTNGSFDAVNPFVELTIKESGTNICSADFIGIQASKMQTEMEDKLGPNAKLSEVMNSHVNGLDMYEIEGQVENNGKVLATAYSAAFFTSNKYFLLTGYALENPAKSLEAFKSVAKTFVIKN